MTVNSISRAFESSSRCTVATLRATPAIGATDRSRTPEKSLLLSGRPPNALGAHVRRSRRHAGPGPGEAQSDGAADAAAAAGDHRPPAVEVEGHILHLPTARCLP